MGGTLLSFRCGKTLRTMPVFRCYFIDRLDRIRDGSEIEARSLGEAINQARQLLKARPEQLSFEIWQGGQRVHPEHREDGIEEAAERLEGLLGSLARTVREPRPHKNRGRSRRARLKGTSEM